MDPSSAFFGLAIFLATFLRPIAAVVVTRQNDARRDEYQRRLNIFRTLMATRAIGLSPERVSALNMIQIDFAKHLGVLSSWNELLRHYGTSPPSRDGDSHVFFRERQRLSTVLMSEMAKVLHLEIEKLDILDRVYYPDCLVQLENDQEVVRNFLVALAEGRRAVPFVVFNPPGDKGGEG